MLDTHKIIRKLLPFRPEKIILFGSFAAGKVNDFSDVDLLIIKKTRKRPPERIADVLKLVWGNIPHIEPQVLTPDELNDAIKNNNFFITQEVLKHGKVIYETKN